MKDYGGHDQIALSDLIKVLFSYKIIIFCCVVVSALASILLAMHLPNKYVSEVSLVIADDNNDTFGSVTSQIGGLAGLAGINLSAGQGAKNALIAKELLQSKKFITDFVERYDLTLPVVAATEWDKQQNKLLFDEELYNVEKSEWVIGDENRQPLSIEIYKSFLDFLTVSEDSKSGIIRIEIEFYQPDMAKSWLVKLMSDVNSYIQRKDIEQTQKSINYLTNLADQTNNASLKQTFYNLIEEQTKKLMLAELRDEYVFQTIDPPNLPEKKSGPRRALIVVAGTFFGTLLAMLSVLFFAFIKVKR